MYRWGLVASCDLDRHRARNVHAGICLKERNAALGVQDTAPCACLQERPAQRRINSVSIQTNVGIGQMYKVVNCNSLFLNSLFGSGLLFRGEGRALMNDDAGRQSEMNIPIPRQSVCDELSAIVARKMGLPIVLGKRGRTASYDDSLAQFVEDLRHTCRESGTIQALKETDAHKTR